MVEADVRQPVANEHACAAEEAQAGLLRSVPAAQDTIVARHGSVEIFEVTRDLLTNVVRRLTSAAAYLPCTTRLPSFDSP